MKTEIHRQAITSRRPSGRPGEAFQIAVGTSAQIYARQGLGEIHEVAVPYVQVGTVSHGRHQGRPIIQRLPSTVDFTGHLFGIPVAIECKSFADNRAAVSSGQRTLIHNHQLKFLSNFVRSASVHGRPAVGILLVEFRACNRIFAIPAAWFLDRIGPRKSIPLREIKADCLEISRGTRGVPVDFALAVCKEVSK